MSKEASSPNESEPATLSNIIESDVICNVFQFLGFKESTRAFCKVSKLCQKKHRDFYTTTKLSTKPTAKLVEKEGRIICAILDALKWAVLDLRLAELSPAAQRVVRSMQDLHALRGMGLYEDLVKLNAYCYSYWHRGAATTGVFPWLTEAVKVNTHLGWEEPLERDVQYWKDSRVSGDFFLLFDREDGSILVSADLKKVYLVLGHANSLGEICRVPRKAPKLLSIPTFHENIIAMRITTSLLSWQGSVVYDGLMLSKGPITAEQRRGAFRAYAKAVDKGTLITSLQLRNNTPTGGAVSQAKQTGTPAPPSPPTSIPSEHTTSVNAIIARVAAAKSLFDVTSSASKHPSSGGNVNAMWVFRRHGYTARENPNNLVTVMQGGNPLIVYHQYSALVPSMYEILVLVDKAVSEGRGKPGAVAIDVEYAVEALHTLLHPAGVRVIYYPPPSAEEQAFNDMTNPFLSPQRKNTGPVCAVCLSTSGEGEGELLRCSRCKDEYYCCREHQKMHWKRHKQFCVQV